MHRRCVTIASITLLLLSLLTYQSGAGTLFDPVLNPLRDYLVRTVTRYVSTWIDGTVEVGALRGSLLSAPVLQNVVLRDAQGVVVAQIEEVRLAYTLTSLLRGRLDVNQFDIVRPQITIVQEPDGRLNLSRIIGRPPPDPPEAPVEPPPEEPGAGFGLPFAIVLEQFQVLEGQLAVAVPALPGVQQVSDVQVRLNGRIDAQGLRAQVQQVTAQATPANVAIRTLEGTFQAVEGVTRIDQFRLHTDATSVTADGVLPGSAQPASLTLQVEPLDVEEVGRVLHNEMLHGQVRLALRAEGPADALMITSQIHLPEGQVDFQGQVNTVATPLTYDGRLDVAGLNLASMIHHPALQSDMNLRVQAQGAGVSPEELQSDIRLEIQPSHLGDIALRPSQIHLVAQQQRFQVHRFDLDTSIAHMTASGALDLAGTSDLRYELQATLGDLRALLGVEALAGEVFMQGQATGEWPDLSTHGTLEARQLVYEDNRLQSLRLQYDGSQLGSQPRLGAHLLAQQAQAGTVPVGEVRMEATYDGVEDRVRFAAEVEQSPDVSLHTNGTVAFVEAGQEVTLEELVIRLPERTWEATAPVQIALGEQRVRFQQVHLAHGDESIALSGAINGENLDDVRLQISELDLSYLRRLLELPGAVGGRATLQFELAGTLPDPLMQGELALRPEPPETLPLAPLHATLAYEGRLLRAEIHLEQVDREVLTFNLRLPVDLSLTAVPLEERLVDAPLALYLLIDELPLEVVRHVQPTLPDISGTLGGTVEVQGTYASLTLKADAQLTQVAVAGTAEQIHAPISLNADIVTADSVPALAQELQRGELTAAVPRLELHAPTIQGHLPSAAPPPQPFQVRDLLLQAEGQWSPAGLEATVRTLRLQASGLGLPRTDVDLAAHWTPQEFELTRLLASLPQSEVRGRGRLTMPGQELQFHFDIPRLRLDDLPITLPPDLPRLVQGTVSVQGSVQAPQTEARLRYAGAQIVAAAQAQLREPLPRYQATLQVDGLDAAQVLPPAQGRLQARVQVDGTGFAAEERRADLDLSLASDRFNLAPGLAANLRANVHGEAIRLEELRVRSVPVELLARGELSEAQQVDLAYTVTLGDLSSLEPLLGAVLQASGTLSGEVQGPLEAMRARANLRVDQWQYAELSGQLIRADLTAAQVPSAPQANLTMQLADVQGPGLPPSSLRIEAQYADPRGTFTASVTSGPYQRSMLAGDVALNDAQRLTLSQLRFQHQELVWQNDGPIEVVRGPEGAMQVQRLVLRSGPQEISVQGRLLPDGPIAAEVRVRQLQIRPTVQAVAPDAAVPAGQVTLDLTVGGTTQQPEAQGQLQLTALEWQEQPLGEVDGTVDLAADVLRTDLRWQYQGQQLLLISGTLGLSPQGELAMQVQAPNVDLGLLTPLSPAITQSAGTLRLDLGVTGTPQQPDARGSLTIANGALQLAATGELYRDIAAQIVFAGNRVEIQELHVGSRSGPLNLTGWVQTAEMTLQQVNLSIQAQDFTAMYARGIEAVISTDIAVHGSMQAMDAVGTVTVSRARAVLQNIPGIGPPPVESWELTVEGVYGPGPQAVDVNGNQVAGPPGPIAPLPFLRTDIRVNIPRNVWVHAPGTTIEVSGEVDVLKEREGPFVLAGTISTVRGFASFYGRRFMLERGEVTFTGSPEIDPVLNVAVTHTVSNYVVTIQVEGRARQPEINLSSTPELPETDIISLLLLGKTSDRLTSAEQGALSTQLQQFAGSLIAGQLEKVLAEPLGLDVIEVTPGEGPGLGGIAVGRYITQDLFLSYEREFRDPGGNKVNLEYSITPELRLRGSSSDRGESSVDFLWRRDY